MNGSFELELTERIGCGKHAHHTRSIIISTHRVLHRVQRFRQRLVHADDAAEAAVLGQRHRDRAEVVGNRGPAEAVDPAGGERDDEAEKRRDEDELFQSVS